MKEPILVVFDIDGTIARQDIPAPQVYQGNNVLSLTAWPNMKNLVRQYMLRDHVRLMFCTGRPASQYGVTWRWLNGLFHLGSSGKHVGLVCRPDEIPLEQTARYKLTEVTRAIRRLGSQPAGCVIYEDSIRNLQLLNTLKPMVRSLQMFIVDDGVATPWSM